MVHSNLILKKIHLFDVVDAEEQLALHLFFFSIVLQEQWNRALQFFQLFLHIAQLNLALNPWEHVLLGAHLDAKGCQQLQEIAVCELGELLPGHGNNHKWHSVCGATDLASVGAARCSLEIIQLYLLAKECHVL